MSIPSAIRHPWLSIRQCARKAQARLRGNIATALLVLLFGLSLSEPLLCVIHCQIWLPIAYHNYHAAMHHDHHAQVQATAQSSTYQATNTAADGSSSMPVCATFGPTGSPMPLYVPPSPVHDLVLTLLSVGILLLFANSLPVLAPSAPPQLAPPRLFRPPKFALA